MFGSTLYHCPFCRESWVQSACFAASYCQKCGGTSLEEYSTILWELVNGRVVRRSPDPPCKKLDEPAAAEAILAVGARNYG